MHYFFTSLEHGRNAEKDLVAFLTSKNFDAKLAPTKGVFEQYDVEFINSNDETVYLEVKRDSRALTSGLIAVEVGKHVGGEYLPSGINATGADMFVYVLDGVPGFWAIDVSRLKTLTEVPEYAKLRGGDNMRSQLVLVPFKDYRKYATELTKYFSN